MAYEDLGYEMDGAFSDPAVAGPLLGGGATQAASLATRLLFKKRPKMVKWSSAIGLLIGGGLSTALMFTRHRQAGISGLLTAALIAVPKQIEDLMASPAQTNGYLGVITPEREMAGAFGYGGYDALGAQDMSQDIQLLDAGSGSTGVLGVITPEREMAGAFGAEGQSPMSNDIELLGFGSNFLSA